MKRSQFYVLVVLVVISGFAGGIFAARFCGNVAHAQSDNVLEVEMLRIVDKDGIPRIALMTEKGEPKLVMIGKNGITNAALCTNDGEPSLLLIGKNGMANAGLLTNDGDATLALRDANSRNAFLTASKTITGLLLKDPINLNNAGLQLTKDSAGLLINMDNIKPGLMLGQLQGVMGLSLNNVLGEPAVLLGRDDEGVGILTFNDIQGNPILSVGADGEMVEMSVGHQVQKSQSVATLRMSRDGEGRIDIRDMTGRTTWSATIP